MSDYTQLDIESALRTVGVEAGDSLFTHSNTGFFGRPEGARTHEEIALLYKRAVFNILGPEGTWVVPTFSWSFCRGKDFDVEETAGECGMLSEMIRRDPQALRSIDANFSVAAIGKDASYFTENPPEHTFGPDSFFERFLKKGGKICNFNFDSASTFIHYVEKSLNVSYRYDKAFTGTLIRRGAKEKRTFYHFVYDLEKPYHAPDFSLFDSIAKAEGKAVVANVGKGQIVLISAKDTFSLIEHALQKDPLFLTVKDKENREGFGR